MITIPNGKLVLNFQSDNKPVEYDLFNAEKPWCFLLHKNGIYYAADWDTHEFVEISAETCGDYQDLYLAFFVDCDKPVTTVNVPKLGIVNVQEKPKRAEVLRDSDGRIAGIEELAPEE